MKSCRFIFGSLLLSAGLTVSAQAQTVDVAGATIQVADAQASVDLSAEFAALRHTMREQAPNATLVVHAVDGRVSLRAMPTTFARVGRR